MNQKLCKHCRHHIDAFWSIDCHRPVPSVITGTVPLLVDCAKERDSGECGPDAKFYESHLLHRIARFFTGAEY